MILGQVLWRQQGGLEQPNKETNKQQQKNSSNRNCLSAYLWETSRLICTLSTRRPASLKSANMKISA